MTRTSARLALFGLGVVRPFTTAHTVKNLVHSPSCAALAIFSAVITYFFIRPLSHDGMAEEDRKFREYLEQNGYDTSQMGLPGADTEISSADYDEKKDHMVSTTTV